MRKLAHKHSFICLARSNLGPDFIDQTTTSSPELQTLFKSADSHEGSGINEGRQKKETRR